MSTGTDVAAWDPAEFGNVGMEDVGAADLVIPRLSIKHAEGVFVNNLSKEEIPVLNAVILGLVKQRIMWDDDVEEGDKPQCKSPDHDHGFPQMREDIEYSKQFPWDQSNFDKANFPPNERGLIELPCNSCVFNQWGKDPRSGKSIPPRCSEQHTYPLAYTTDGGESYTTAIVTFQRTGIKPSKSYLSTFAQANMPMFTSFTELTLQVNKRGTVEYSVPIFKKGGPTDRNNWRQYADSYVQIREFLRTPPRGQGEDEGDPVAPSDNTNTAPVVQTAPAAPPVQQAAPVVVQQPAAPAAAPAASAPTPPPAPAAGEDELPF